jgi:hypothetical protein
MEERGHAGVCCVVDSRRRFKIMEELERVNKRLKSGRDDLVTRLDEKLQQLSDEEKKLLDRQSE